MADLGEPEGRIGENGCDDAAGFVTLADLDVAEFIFDEIEGNQTDKPSPISRVVLVHLVDSGSFLFALSAEFFEHRVLIPFRPGSPFVIENEADEGCHGAEYEDGFEDACEAFTGAEH